MARINCNTLNENINKIYDIVVIGSGPAGASCAAKLAEAGLSIAIIEEGTYLSENYSNKSLGSSFARLYRDGGSNALMGTPPIPFLQGKAVGGSSVINGAISWQLPKDVYQSWITNDPALEQTIPWETIISNTQSIEQRLNIQATPEQVAGPRNLLMKKAADKLGLENRAISRNVKDCLSSGMCLHACPNGAKQSMDLTYLLDAENSGADIYYHCKAETINHQHQRVSGISCKSANNKNLLTFHAKRVVLAASAIQSPVLLLKSKIKHGPVGKNFQCHPGISVSGIFKNEIHNWQDATQGHEIIGLRKQGIKFESAAMDVSVFGMRLPGTGLDFMKALQNARHGVDWAAAIKSNAKGSVNILFGQTIIQWSPSADDMLLFRTAAATLAKLFFAVDAKEVNLGVYPHAQISSMKEVESFEKNGSLNPKDYNFAVTHMFGTCRMGSNKNNNVVGPDFQHHQIQGLYIADSSVFPSNTGVNPQTSIIALSQICASHVINHLN